MTPIGADARKLSTAPVAWSTLALMAAITAQLLQTMRWTDIHAKAPTSRHRTVYALVFFVILIGMYFEVYSKVKHHTVSDIKTRPHVYSKPCVRS